MPRKNGAKARPKRRVKRSVAAAYKSSVRSPRKKSSTGSHYHSGARGYGAAMGRAKTKAARSAAAKKAAATRKRKAAARSAAAQKAARTRKRNQAKKGTTRKTTASRRRRTTRSGYSKKWSRGDMVTFAGKRKNPMRKRRRKATRRRATTSRRKNPTIRRKRARALSENPRRRRRRASTKRRRRNPAPPLRSNAARRRKRRPSTTRRRRRNPARTTVRSLRRARRSILNAGKRKGHTRLARAYAKRARLSARKYSRNPSIRTGLMGVVDVVKGSIPVALSLYGSRAVSRRLIPMIPGIGKMGDHAHAVGSLGMIFLGMYATKKVAFLRKHKSALLLGLGVNAIDTILTTYAPKNVKAQIGLPLTASQAAAESAPAPSPQGEYVEMGQYESEMGEYVEIGQYESELGEYVEIGAESELGQWSELGDGAFLNQGIGTGIGMPTETGMIRAVGQRDFVAPVPARSFVKNVPDATPRFDNMHGLYSGIFSGGL